MRSWPFLPYLVCTFIIISACLVTGCISGQDNAGIPGSGTAIPSIQIPSTTIVTPDVMIARKPTSNLTISEPAELYSGNLNLLFSISDKNRDPIKKTVNFKLSVKNVGTVTVADLQKKLSDLYAVDRYGNQYNVPTHVALLGLKPGEIRSGSVEIADVPDQALPGLEFHYRFGDEEASWVLIPDTPV
jgi:hypothetical protein